jgi:hypothetical protein
VRVIKLKRKWNEEGGKQCATKEGKTYKNK